MALLSKMLGSMAGKSQNPCHMTGEFHHSISEMRGLAVCGDIAYRQSSFIAVIILIRACNNIHLILSGEVGFGSNTTFTSTLRGTAPSCGKNRCLTGQMQSTTVFALEGTPGLIKRLEFLQAF